MTFNSEYGSCSTALVLSGGHSLRMGRDKSNLKLPDGQTLLQRAVQLLETSFSQVIVCGGSDTPDCQALTVQDHFPDMGPMAGLHAGLLAAESDWCFVMACDMPSLQMNLIEHLQYQLCTDVDAVVVSLAGRKHPLCGWYHKRILPILEERIREHKRSMKGLLEGIRCQCVELQSWSGEPAAQPQLDNINTPAAWEHYLQSLN